MNLTENLTENVIAPPLPAAGPAARFGVSANLIGGFIAVGTVSIWLLLIFNRFLTPHEGWFSYYGLLMKNGKVPYRDFYFFTQPFHLFITRVISEFTDKLVYFRVYGMIDRVLITAVYYYLLSRQLSAAAAVCGTIASSFFFLAYPTDALFSYLYTCLLFLLVALACLHKAWRSERSRNTWMLLTGVAAAFCFFTKQSNGLIAIAGIGFTMLVVAENLKQTWQDWLRYTAGLIVGSFPFVAWLLWSGAWNSYLNQVFLGAAASKGGLKAVLFGFLSRQVSRLSVAAFVLLIVALGVLILARQLSFRGPRNPAHRLPAALTIGAVSAAALFGVVASRTTTDRGLFQMARATTVSVNVVLYLLLPVLAYVLYRRFISSGRSFVVGSEVPVALVIASVYWTYACGMSWNVAEQSLIPSLGLLLAFSYDRISIANTRLMSLLVVLAAIGLTQVGIWHKWNLSFNWEGWFEGMSVERGRSHWPEIAGFEIAPNEVAMYDTILDDIAKNTKPGEPIVTLFTIPLFNFVGQHWQPTFAPVHYWDVCPDDVAARDAERVKAARPKMIVELELADWVWKEHEEGWRAGHTSGQRAMQDAVDGLTASGDYRRLHTFKTPRYKMDLVVWLRER